MSWLLIAAVVLIGLAIRRTMKKREGMTEQEKSDEQFRDAW